MWKKVSDTTKPWGRLNLVMEIRKVLFVCLFVFLTNNVTLWLMIQFYLGRNKSKELSEEGALCRKARGWMDLRIWKRTTGATIKKARGASLVAQWLRICLLMQGTRVRALVWVDPTCRGATRPVSHNYWACASGACAPQEERPR